MRTALPAERSVWMAWRPKLAPNAVPRLSMSRTAAWKNIPGSDFRRCAGLKDVGRISFSSIIRIIRKQSVRKRPVTSSHPKHRHQIAWVAGWIYFAQGALGVSSVALPLFLRSHRWSVTEITTVMSIAAVPWIFKILYGIFSDGFPIAGYRRKSYLFIYLVLCASGWLCLAFLPPSKANILLALLIANTGFAAIDVVTDALVVEHSTAVSSSIYQSVAWGARSFGAIVGSLLGGWLAAHWDPRAIFMLTMLFPISSTLFVWRLHEKRQMRGPFIDVLTPAKKCWQVLWTRDLKLFMLLLLIMSLSSSFGMPFFFFMKETLKFRETFLGLLSSLGWFGAMMGSILYLTWLRKFPAKKILRWAILINSLNILTVLFIHNERSAFIVLLVSGVMGCLVMLPMMSAAAILTHHSKVEGAVFAILMSVFNLGQILFGLIGGRLYSIIGLPPLIAASGILGLAGILLVERLVLPIRYPLAEGA